ncbi:hypothetical protein BCR44DRAFT_49413 [Catenaria anguillulae PL171]|uniref:Uncharacterized protein n=1 Tax=Catenaria anguillulae PL171 TaxID=765915 RepID=A0A1Y2HIN5_9FUNG|nr:hypothetical protein BCR44DRAFT_49413 [Catenaria anguillulae PL171]
MHATLVNVISSRTEASDPTKRSQAYNPEPNDFCGQRHIHIPNGFGGPRFSSFLGILHVPRITRPKASIVIAARESGVAVCTYDFRSQAIERGDKVKKGESLYIVAGLRCGGAITRLFSGSSFCSVVRLGARGGGQRIKTRQMRARRDLDAVHAHIRPAPWLGFAPSRAALSPNECPAVAAYDPDLFPPKSVDW